jgi:predicted O-linked N-acetylglucosamine transferase (SPINDLY family)
MSTECEIKSNVDQKDKVYEEDLHKTYSVIYRDGMVIERTAEELAQATRTLITTREQTEKRRESLQQQLLKLYTTLKTWSQENQSELSATYIVPRHEVIGGFLFLAVQKDNKYNAEFSRNLTLLENEIEESNNFNLISLKVFEMPKISEETIQSFLPIADAI